MICIFSKCRSAIWHSVRHGAARKISRGLLRYLIVAAAGAIVVQAAEQASAAEFPNHPLQLIVPYAPGGVTDQVARILAQGLEKRLGQPTLVINRAGAGTIVGTQSVARATPDGYTLVLVSVPHVSNISLYKELPYRQSDFAPVTPVANNPNVLVVNAALPVQSLADLIAYIKAHPGQINYATFGIGTSAHLCGLLLESMIGEKMTAVHYRGGAPALVGVMTGEVQFTFGGPLSIAGALEAGKIKAIAVTSQERLAILPNVPTMAESGLDYVKGTWFGLLAPAQTPKPIIDQLYQAVRETMAEPDVRKTVVDSGTEVFVTSPDEFTRFIADETQFWARVLGDLSIEKQ
jgi:tripartite-type tricarboxylate transporter receptor subunit TctC